MKNLTVIAAGFGWSVLERNCIKQIAGLEFSLAESVFSAVTCVAQASLRTALKPQEHGMISNGVWINELKILLQTGEYEYSSELGENYDILLVRKGSWCSYKW